MVARRLLKEGVRRLLSRVPRDSSGKTFPLSERRWLTAYKIRSMRNRWGSQQTRKIIKGSGS